MSAVEKKRASYLYIEYLRVICAFAVIVIHVSGENWFHIDIGSGNWIAQTFYNVCSRFSVCVFCMISGALLLRPSKEIGMHEVLTHYVKRILICFVAWVILYALFYTAVNHEGLQYFVQRLVKLPDHLWYLLMLMGMYLTYPAIRMITKDRTVTRNLILLLAALSTLSTVADTSGFFADMAGESLGYSLWTSFLGNLGTLKVGFAPGYLCYFLLGHYIHEYGLGTWHRPIVVSAIPALLLSAALTVWISMLTGKYVYTFMLEHNPFVILSCAGIFAFARGPQRVVRPEEARSQLAKAMVWVGGNTFGIYLIHFALRDLLSLSFGFNVASYPALLSVPVNSLLIFGASLALTALLKRIPGVSKILS